MYKGIFARLKSMLTENAIAKEHPFWKFLLRLNFVALGNYCNLVCDKIASQVSGYVNETGLSARSMSATNCLVCCWFSQAFKKRCTKCLPINEQLQF